MPRIIEIYRDRHGLGIPGKFTIGAKPVILGANGDEEDDTAPVVKQINFWETGAFKGDAYRGPCFVIQFVDSDVRRVIPASEVFDIAYDSESSKLKAIKSKLEDTESDIKTPELPEK